MRSLDSALPYRRPTGCTLSVAIRNLSLVFLTLITMVACNATEQGSAEAQEYRSVWNQIYPDKPHLEHPQTSLLGGFHFAAAAETRAIAEQRWAEFIHHWTPAGGEFDDAMHSNFVTWAELEALRIRYLKESKQAEASEIEGKLRDLAASIE